MVLIKKILKSKKAILCLFAIAVILSSISPLLFDNSEKGAFEPSSSKIIISRWENKSKRRADIVNKDLSKAESFETKLDGIPFSQTQIVIKTNNLRFTLSTKGKILFSNTDKRFSGYGKQIHIIDIRDLKSGAVLRLFAEPVKGENGRIENAVILTTKNDYLLDLVCSNAKVLALILILFSAFLFAFSVGTINILKKKKSAPRMIYFSLCLLIADLLLLLNCDLSQFIIHSDTAKYIAFYSAYSLLGIFVSAFLCSVMKLKSKMINIFNISVIAYTVFRLILFFFFLVPLSSAVFISSVLLILSIILPITLKLCRNYRQSFNHCWLLSSFFLSSLLHQLRYQR